MTVDFTESSRSDERVVHRYVRIRLHNDSRGVLYERDFKAKDAFDLFVRVVVSNLIDDETMQKGDAYTARLIPHYGEMLRRAPIFRQEEGTEDERGWLDLTFEEPVSPEKPVRFFSLEVRVPKRRIYYRRDFQIPLMGRMLVEHGIEKALVDLGVLKAGDAYQVLFFAREDDRGEFERETIPALSDRAKDIVDILGEEAAPELEPLDPAAFDAVETVDALAQDDVQIYVRKATLDALVAEAKLSVEVERGGMLVGHVHADAAGGRPIVEITDLTVSEGTVASIAQLTYTFESWQKHKATMDDRFPGKRVVGWYHTHLIGIGAHKNDAGMEVPGTKLFFSRDDAFTHKTFFPDEWYVAMVLDPEGKNVFFQWKQGEIAPCQGYRVFDRRRGAGDV